MTRPLRGPLLLSALAGFAALSLACTDRSLVVSEFVSPTPTAQGTAAAATQTSAPATVAPTQQATPQTASGDLTVAQVVALAEPSVVRIETGGGVGTGFIVSEDGYLITNFHVVEARTGGAAAVVNVTLSDGEVVSGAVVGTDPRADLAVVKIEGGPYRALELGDLDEVVIGQDVVAIGYALDLDKGEGPSYSVTRGIVSQKNRAISESAPILGAIQTDAAINHGNSGGPLLNMKGEVIGVNTALAPDPLSPTGIAQGIGFAVGVDTVKAAWPQMRDTGTVDRGYLGIFGFEALRPARARDLGIPEEQGGVYLGAGDSVVVGSPAADAGLRAGDVIIRIGESDIESEADIAVAMIENNPGDIVEVEIYRGSERMTVEVLLGVPDS